MSSLVAPLILSGLLFSAVGAGAEEAPAESLAESHREPAATVYATATVTERPVEEATSSVSVEDREALEDRGALRAMEILHFVPGLSLLSTGPAGLAAVQIRGGDPNFTRVLVDGVPVNDGTYQVGGVFDFQALPAEGVERVEVVRGPLSAFYGSTGLAGAVHLVTRRGEGPAGGTLKLTAGDADLRRGALSAGGGGERAGGFVSLVGEEEEGRVADERFELLHLQARGRLRAGPADLALAGRLADWQADDYPDASGGPVFGSGELRRSEHDEESLGLRLALVDAARRSHRGEASVYRHHLDRRSPAVFPLVPASVEETRFTRGRLGWGAGRETSEIVEVSYGAGAEWEEGINRSVLFLPPFLGGAVPGDYSLERTTGGVFGEVVWRRERWTAELDLRADVTEGRSAELSPRLGVAWSPDASTRLRASLGRAFKLPSFFALASPPALGGNPGLEPETMVGGDLGMEHAVPGRGLQLALTAFAHRYENLVDFDFDAFTHLNRSEVDSIGAELAVSWHPRPGVSAAGNLTWQEVEDRATGRPLRHRPEWAGGLRLDWRPATRRHGSWQLGADLRFASESRDQQIPVPEREIVAGREILGLAAAWEPAPAWRLALRVDNLTDEEYETSIGFPGPGRSARLGLSWSFGGARDGEPDRE